MKIHIWIKKEDVTIGTITEYHTQLPQVNNTNYVQVSISVDEFARLEETPIYTIGIDGPGIITTRQ